jgi:AAHS family 4-hydroxybenzoate transporter-like MFS transporter
MREPVDVGELLEVPRLGIFHFKLIAISFLLMMSEGFDLGAAAFGGPGILKEWSLSHAELGILLSSSLAAGFLGPPIFGFLSDRFGRRFMVVCGVYAFGLLTLAAVATNAFAELLVLRIFAGIALAGTLPVIITFNNEFAPFRFRSTLVVLIFVGVTFGGALPGVVAAKYMGLYGWRVLFWVGGIAPLIIGTAFALLMPESAKFLALRPGRRAELLRLMRRLRPDVMLDDNANFVIRGEDNRGKFAMRTLVQGRLAALTPLFWISNLVGLMIFYFMNQLLPTALSESGLSVTQAAVATVVFNMGGTTSGLVIMRLLDKFGFIPVPILFACGIPLVACVGIPGLSPTLLILAAAGAGFCLMGVQCGNVGTEGNIYPTYVRTWGVGSNFAAGRVGGALGPLLGGFAFSAHLPTPVIFGLATLPLFVGLFVGIVIVPRYSRHLRLMQAQSETVDQQTAEATQIAHGSA